MNEDGLEFGTTKQFDGPEGNQYNELTLLREQERANAIKKGLIDDPDRPKALEDAKIFIGTCQDMCPMYEREQREYQNDVKRWEINPATGRIDRNLAVKAFHRPAAGNEQALPSDVRPPDVLTRTLDYLITEIVSNCDPLDKDTHGFVRDRTRSIRQDFTLQNERGLQAIDCHERIVRFHILSLHHMCEIDGFDAHQEMEQLRKTLQSLAEYYDDQQKNNVQCPNEAEFRAYHILTRMRDPDVLRHVQTLRLDVRKSSVVRQALNIYKFAQRSNEEIGRFKPPNCEGSQNLYSRFFSLIRHETTSYTVACLCETQFNDVRKGALKSMRKSFISAVKAPSVEELVQLLGCDNVAEVVNYCEQFGIIVRADDDGIMRPVLNKTSHFDESRPDLRQSFSRSLVEAKRGSLTFAQVINGSRLVSSSNVQMVKTQTDIQTTKSFAIPTKPYNLGLQPDFPATARNGIQSNLVPTISTQPSFAVPTMSPTVPTKLTEAPTEIPRKSSTPTTADINRIQPVLPPSPVKPTIDLHSILASAASSVVSQLLQKHSRETVQESIGKVKYEREAEARKHDALLQKFSQELNHGLMNDLLYGIASECFADRWRNTHCKRAAWSVLSRTSKRVQVKRKLEAARLKAKEERDEQYANAFALLRDNQSSRNRKRRRSPAASETATKVTCVRATDIATQFWKPLDLSKLLSVFENEVTGHKLPTRWDILLYPSTMSSPSTQWLATKFALDAQTNMSRSLAIRQTTVNVRLVHDVQSENCSEVGAIIFECSTDSDPSVDRVRLISLVQEVANKSDHKIVIMILRFRRIEDQVALAKALMVPEMLADRKTPVTDCKFVSIEGMEDVVNFEHVLQDLLANISLGISPLGQERHASAEQERRRKAPVPTPDEAPPLKKLRNSFYDSGPMVPRALQRPAMALITQQEQMPTQLAQLMQNLQSAKELLRKSVT